AYASRIDLLEKKGRLHKILAGISSDCHLDKWSLHNRNCHEINCTIMAQDFSPATRRKSAGILCVFQALTTKLPVKKASQNVQVIAGQFLTT
ncbi:MAG: hypothetical protein IJU29_08325, partial [Oscillospiraceae bacterium]|nr:hypothetical protein [Oscillospiraceae bacterium]